MHIKMPIPCFWLSVFVLGFLPMNTVVAKEVMNPNYMAYVMNGIMRDVGSQELKKFITTHFEVTSGHFNMSRYLRQFKDSVLRSISKRSDMLKRLRAVVAANYAHSSRTSPFKECYKQNIRNLRWSQQRETFVSFKGMCLLAPPWLKRNKDVKYPTKPILNVFMKNYKTDRRIRWQFFTGEDGLSTIFPSTKQSHDVYSEARLRPWYTNVCTSPKDIVILVDTSAAMKWTKIKVAKTIAHLLVQGANQNDKVSVFGFAGTKTSFSLGGASCFDRVPVSPSGLLLQALFKFIASLSAKGSSRYKTGLDKAFSILANQDNATRHNRRVIVLISGTVPIESKRNVAKFIKDRIGALKLSVMLITICIDCTPRIENTMRRLGNKGNQACISLS
ncbi:VWFA and cache domain-containing protein 1 [Lamellibrachia satsuma]|nr:VWFA and cache domain-containing protein 1 [Lamellibrachia satsuma]